MVKLEKPKAPTSAAAITQQWFDQDIFQGLEIDGDAEDEESVPRQGRSASSPLNTDELEIPLPGTKIGHCI